MDTTSQAAVGLQLIEPGQRVTVRVPATTANLGPGYDSLGLALALHDTLTVESLDTDELVFELRGEGADTLPRDASHLVVRAMDAAFERLGFRHGGLKVTAENVNPHGRGLGSSASAVVAAVSAANAMVPVESRRGKEWILQLTSEMEGHPDHVAPPGGPPAPPPSHRRSADPSSPSLPSPISSSPPKRPAPCCPPRWGTMPRR